MVYHRQNQSRLAYEERKEKCLNLFTIGLSTQVSEPDAMLLGHTVLPLPLPTPPISTSTETMRVS